jgi:hypothetical protein
MTRNENKNEKRSAVNEPTITEESSTLRELGIPGNLAADLESAFRLMGATSGERVVGFTFVTPDGKRHALRQDTASAPAVRRAA